MIADRSSRFLQIKQDDKFFSKLSSKDQNISSSKGGTGGEASFRVNYYGGVSGAVPFTWETCPGTPKHTLFLQESNSLPPLTPPPSYLFSPNSGKKNPKSRINFQSIFPRFSHSRSLSSSSVSSSSMSSSFSAPSTPRDLCISRSRNSTGRRSRSVIHFGLDEDEDEKFTTSRNSSTRCFGGFGSRSAGANGKLRMYQPVKNMKKTLLSIVGGNGATAN